MLQFLKKSARKKNLRSSSSSNNINEVGEYFTKDDTNDGIDKDFNIIEAEKYVMENQESLQQSQKSKLSRNLADILFDKNCLCYFVQYLETKQSLPLIKFWLDIESFRAASESCSKSSSHSNNFKYELNELNNRTEDFTRLTLNKRLLNKSMSSDGCDSLSYSSFDCDAISNFNENDEELVSMSSDNVSMEQNISENEKLNRINNTINEIQSDEKNELCDTTLWRSLTDDEKSKIRDEKKTTSKFQTTLSTDAIRIYRKYLVSSSSYYVDIPATLSSNISLSLCSNSDLTNLTAAVCFDEAQKYVFDRMEKEYLNTFIESVFYCKFTLDTLTSDNLTIYDILSNENILFYFMEFLEKYDQRNYLDFLLTSVNFKNQISENLPNCNYKEIQNDAMVIYEKYFSLQATNSLKLPDRIRYHIEENICDENSDYTKISNCFDLPISIIEYYLDKKFFKYFLKSQLFYNYLTELFNKIHHFNDLNKLNRNTSTKKPKKKQNQHRKTYSDCTNDSTRHLMNNLNNISSHNTLLAMESSIKKNSTDMQIDSRQLNNPDLLWQRNSSISGCCSSNNSSGNVLSLGRITSLGRYERNFDMNLFEDDKWNSNKIKNAVKKFVKLPEDKVQEELAWEIAEMIVKDITNVTLNNNNNFSSNKET